VLIISAIHGHGSGAEEVLEQYLRAGGNAAVTAPLNSRFPEVCRETGHSFYPMATKRDSFHWSVWNGLRQTRPPGIELIHSWCARSLETAMLLSARWKCPYTAGMHDHPVAGHHRPLRRRLIRFGLRRAAKVMAVSESLAYEIQTLLPSLSVHVIRNGILDIPLPPERPPSAPVVVGFMGMNSAGKGFETVVDWAMKTDVEWRLFGNPCPETKARMGDLPGKCRIRQMGWHPPSTLYGDLDLVVVPSLVYEALSMVALEAARAGIPVVASAIGGLVEIVEDATTGFLFPPGQPEQGLARFRELCSDIDLRRRLGKQARERYEREFTSSRMRDELDAFWGSQPHKSVASPPSSRHNLHRL
jgi:glycosyltransferase involved in cell wall biosynthesis